MQRLTALLVAVCVSAFCISSISATVIHVPADQPTIQAGIDTASTGDTVLVSAGVYAEHLVFTDKALVLKATSGPTSTSLIVPNGDNISISVSSTPDTVRVIGFRLSNGSGRVIAGYIGVFVIESCVFISASGTAAHFSGSGSSGTFRNNLFLRGDSGAGVYILIDSFANLQLTRNIFYDLPHTPVVGVASGYPTIINNTFVACQTVVSLPGSGLGGCTVFNNIFLDCGGAAVRTLGSTVTEGYNDYFENGANTDGFSPDPSSIFLDPLLVDTAALDFSLDRLSPCIDAGHPDVTYNDLDGTRNDIGALARQCLLPDADCDGDGTPNGADNCLAIANPNQSDADQDESGDACDPCTDTDGDGYGDPGFPASYCQLDNCPSTPNSLQEDADLDGLGNACDSCTDTDGDGFGNPGFAENTCPMDNCAGTSNVSQADVDADSIGDACDNCIATSNMTQANADADALGDACDNCPTIDNADQQDSDGDERGNVCDNCPADYNPSQTDTDSDEIGDICDACLFDPQNDADGDGVCGNSDNCPGVANANQSDADNDGVGDLCDNCPSRFNPAQEETDGDGIADSCDNCPTVFNSSQTDVDADGIGNACDVCLTDPLNDADSDGVCYSVDNCPTVYNPTQADTNGNGIGDVCDCACQCHGDPACDSVIATVVDVVHAIDVAFRNAASDPDPSPTCPREPTDVNCSGSTDVLDVVKSVNVAFRNADAAMEYCSPCAP